MITEYDVQPGEDDTLVHLPNYETEYTNAKTFLQMASKNTGDNLYDHLTEVLNKILAERPENVIDFFEEYSRKVKERRFRPMTDHLEDIYVPPGRFKLAKKMIPMLSPLPLSEPSTVDPEDLELADISKSNMLELLYFLEHCGIGLPRSEMFFVMLSIRKLIHSEPISTIRFWGKIFGTLQDYLIVECELKEEEYIKRNETYQQDVPDPESPKAGDALPEAEVDKALANIAKEQQLPGEGTTGKFPRPLPPEPKIHYEEPPEPPSEPSGVGVNKKVPYCLLCPKMYELRLVHEIKEQKHRIYISAISKVEDLVYIRDFPQSIPERYYLIMGKVEIPWPFRSFADKNYYQVEINTNTLLNLIGRVLVEIKDLKQHIMILNSSNNYTSPESTILDKIKKYLPLGSKEAVTEFQQFLSKSEDNHRGFVYYVCNGIGKPWFQLPDVTPKQIRIARQIYRSFTGNLDEAICTYPEYPGNERELLRAQIARISAGTQISPLGYYTFGAGSVGEGEEEEEAEEGPGGENKTTYRINPKYEGQPIKDLLDGSMSFWVHHAQYILPQGRSTWWNPSPMPDVNDEEMDEELGEEEEEQDKPKIERVEPETGPPLLTPLSEDAGMEAMPPWSVRCSSNIIETFALAIVRSNLWPGAYCFSTQGKLFHNVYFGFGIKYLANNYSPVPLPPIQQEYPLGPEVLEMADPTGAEEEQWRIDHLPKPKPVVAEGEEAEPEEGEEEEDEEDEED